MFRKRPVIRAATVVVGGGPAASSVLANVVTPRLESRRTDCDVNVAFLDPRESMWREFQRDFRMGQSPGTLLDRNAQRSAAPERFMTAGDFSDALDKRVLENLKATGALNLAAKALRIKKYGDNDFQVIFRDMQSGIESEMRARSVFYAPGPGPERIVKDSVAHRPRASGIVRPFAEYPGAVGILTGKAAIGRGGMVGIIGDGPTALWVARVVAEQGNRVIILGPDQANAFAASNPGGRNSEILRALSSSFFTGTLEAVEEREVSKAYDWSEPGTSIVVRNYKPMDYYTRGKTIHLPLSAIVSAVGATPDFSGVLDPALLQSLSVVSGAAALMTQTGDFVLFGAGAYGHAKSLGQALSFDDAGRHIQQPPVGIATIEMGARLLNRTLPRGGWEMEQTIALGDLHPVTATSDELRSALGQYGVDVRGAQEMAAQVLAARSANPQAWDTRDLARALETVLAGKTLVDHTDKV